MVALAILPLGAVEQHGPHLASDTDAHLAGCAAAALGRTAGAPGSAVVLPTLPYGASGEHEGFRGTVSAGTEALAGILLELGRSVSAWADRLLVVNAHGGNPAALTRSVPLLRTEGRDAAWLACRTAEDPRDTHAGHAETSLMLHLDPARVRMDRAEAGCTRPLTEILPDLRAGGLAAVSPNGVLGDPTTATASEGERLWAALLDDARARLGRWAPGDDGRLR